MRFKIGQKVVCIHKGEWVGCEGTKAYCPMPKFNEVVTVSGFGTNRHGFGIELAEYPLAYRSYFFEKWFEPLITDDQLEKELESIEFVNARW